MSYEFVVMLYTFDEDDDVCYDKNASEDMTICMPLLRFIDPLLVEVKSTLSLLTIGDDDDPDK
jgi:hypothetical protein